MGQDWKFDFAGDANDSLCNFIFFHLALSGQAVVHQSQVFTYCLQRYCPRKGFSPSKYKDSDSENGSRIGSLYNFIS